MAQMLISTPSIIIYMIFYNITDICIFEKMLDIFKNGNVPVIMPRLVI